jgi:Ran GTPase-activating protein (RanGAP) involved in mRNA processing and transport
MTAINFTYQNINLSIINVFLRNWDRKETIHKIVFKGNYFTDTIDIVDLFETILPQFPNVETLDFSDTGISCDEFSYILKYLPSISKIKNLNFSSNLIFYKSLTNFHLLKPCMGQLVELNFNENELHKKGIEIISSYFYEMKNLEKLSLVNCYLTYIEFVTLAKNIHHLKNLSFLDVSYNSISTNSLVYFLQNIPKEQLNHLHMKMISPTSCGIQYFSIYNHLYKCSKLKSLSWNLCINDLLLETISSLPRLQKLCLSDHRHTETLKGVYPFSNTLTNIFFQRISNNNIQFLLQSIPNSVKNIRIENTVFDYETKKILLEKLENMKNITDCSIRYCNIDNVVFKKICHQLEHCSDLEDVNFSGNPIHDSGFRYFFSNLSRWKYLKFIAFHENNISNESIEKILPRLNYVQNQSLNIFLNTGRNFTTDFFKSKINIIHHLYNIIQTNYSSKKEMEQLLKMKNFHHYISLLYLEDKNIKEYNTLLEKTKEIIECKRKYCRFIKEMETKYKHHDIFHFYDLQTLIYEYI